MEANHAEAIDELRGGLRRLGEAAKRTAEAEASRRQASIKTNPNNVVLSTLGLARGGRLAPNTRILP